MPLFSLYNASLRIFGIKGRFSTPIRILVLLLNLSNVVYNVVYIFVNFRCFALTFRLIYYFYDALHTMAIYVCSLDKLDFVRRKKLPELTRWSNLLCVAHAVLRAGIYYEAMRASNDGSFQLDDGPDAWRWFVMFSETAVMAVYKHQAFVIYLGTASSLYLHAKDLDQAVLDLAPSEAELRCRKAMIMCASLDHRFSNILRFMFVEYAVRLMTEIPMSIRELSCGLDRYNFLQLSDRLLSFLLVISAGERIYLSLYRLRKRARSIVIGRQIGMLPFLKVAHGVRVTPSTIVNWKSFCAFIGITSSFSFMVLQYKFSAKLSCATYRSDYC